MSIEINVPTLPESVADATVATWHKKPGDTVKRGQNLVDIETDKIVIEVPAPADGVMGEIAEAEGATVTANQLLGTMTSADAAAPAAEPATSSADTGKAEAIGMPALPESVADATIATWHKKVGDSVKRGENLVDVETDKVVLEVPATVDGVLASIDAAEGSTVTQDSILGSITAGAASAAAPAVAAATASASDDEAGQTSPSVRALLEQHGLQASDVKGSGNNGRILPEDVEAAAKAKASAPADAPATTSAAPQAAAAPAAGKRAEERVPMTRLRKTIANRLLEAKQNTAMLTTFNEVNMKPVMDLRNKYKVQFEKTHGVKLGFMSFFVKAATEALKRYPDINASIAGDDIVYHGYCDVGIAVSSDRGLVVPVLRNAEEMSLAGIEQGIGDYAKAAREGKLGVQDMTGGTFTITNGGVFGSLLSTPILNPPQSAILGMHATQERPVVENGEIVIRPMMYLALSYDHRIVDGAGAVTFLKTIKEYIEDPARILLEM